MCEEHPMCCDIRFQLGVCGCSVGHRRRELRELLKAGQDSLHQSMADKFEELEKENNILKNTVGDLKEKVKSYLKVFQDERETMKSEAEKGAKESVEQGERAEEIMKKSQKVQEECVKDLAEMAAIAAAAGKEVQEKALKDVNDFIEQFQKF